MGNNTTNPFYNTKLPSDWEVKRLLEVSNGKISNGVFNDPRKTGRGYKLINVLDLYTEPRIDTSKLGRIDIDSNEFERNKVKWGDIFFTRSSLKLEGIAHCNINLDMSDEITFDGHVMKISPNQKIIFPEFLRLYCISYQARQFFMSRAKQNTMTTIGQDDISDMLIPIPPLPEQRAIAKLLSTWDEAINKNNQLITQKELCKKLLMQNLLTGKKRLKGFGGEWKEKGMKDVFERVTRKNSDVNTNVVTISAQRGFVKQTDFFNKSIASETLDNYFLVEKGEFCYNKSYSNGYSWGATKRLNGFDKAVVTTLYICFCLKNPQKNSGDFFEQFFEANLLDRGLTKIAHEGGRAHGLLNVTPADFFSLKMTIPEYAEQIAIAQVLQAADKEIQLLKTKTDKLREQKRGLMQVLLTGKVRIKNLNL